MEQPKFRVRARLGAGGMGEVHLALMEWQGQAYMVALKRILPAYAHDPELLRHFEREARVGTLLHHPNVVMLHAFGRDNAGPYLAFEYVNGRSASDLLDHVTKEGQTLPLGGAMSVLRDAARALDYAHALRDEAQKVSGVLHRDVSPDNILVSYDGVAKLADFGLAKTIAGTNKTRTDILRGKFAYIAPELYAGADAVPASDAFALAVCAFRFFAGVSPFQGRNEAEVVNAVLHGSPPTLATLRPEVPEAVERWIMRALAKQPAARPQSVRELVEALDGALAGDPAAARAQVAQTMLVAFPPGKDALRDETTRVLASGTATAAAPSGRKARRLPARRWALLAGGSSVAAGFAVVLLWRAFASPHPGAIAAPLPPPPAPAQVAIQPPAPPSGTGEPAPPPTPLVSQEREKDSRGPSAHRRAPAETTGLLAVKVRPWARVFVDDKLRGITPMAPIALARGSHSVRLVNDDLKQSRVYKVDIQPRMQQELRVVLDEQ